MSKATRGVGLFDAVQRLRNRIKDWTREPNPSGEAPKLRFEEFCRYEDRNVVSEAFASVGANVVYGFPGLFPQFAQLASAQPTISLGSNAPSNSVPVDTRHPISVALDFEPHRAATGEMPIAAQSVETFAGIGSGGSAIDSLTAGSSNLGGSIVSPVSLSDGGAASGFTAVSAPASAPASNSTATDSSSPSVLPNVGGRSTQSSLVVPPTGGSTIPVVSAGGGTVVEGVTTAITLATISPAANSALAGSVSWGDGTASSPVSFVTNANGSIGVIGSHAFNAPGTFSGTVSLRASTASPTNVAFSVTVTRATTQLSVAPIRAVEGQLYTGPIAHWSSSNPGRPVPTGSSIQIALQAAVGNSARIGPRTAGLTPPSNGTIDADGLVHSNAGYRFDAAGSTSLTITVTEPDGTVDTATAPVTVVDAPLQLAVKKLPATSSVQNAVLATLTDQNPAGVVSDLQAFVNWGDGTPEQAATLVSVVGNSVLPSWQVVGSHNFPKSGQFPVTVRVQSVNGSAMSSLVGSGGAAPVGVSLGFANSQPSLATATTVVDGPGASISGYVYDDANDSAVKDPGEAGIAGVTISLISSVGTITTTLTTSATDGTGYYVFGNLGAGTYALKEAQPNAYNDGREKAGTVGGSTVGNTLVNDTIAGITLAYGQSSINNYFGEHPRVPPPPPPNSANILGYVYDDANNDGYKQSGEAGVPGATLTLLNSGGATLGTAITSSDGSYSFTGLAPDTYKVVELQPTAYTDGIDRAGTVNGATVGNTLVNDTIAGITLGYQQYSYNNLFGEHRLGSLRGFVYVDANGNNSQDPTDPAIGNVLLTLWKPASSPGQLQFVGQTFTQSDGTYLFDNLPANSYWVFEGQPNGYLDGPEQIGTTGGVLQVNDCISAIPIASGQKSERNDFAEYLAASLSGSAFEDRDNDSIRATGANAEPGIPGVAISLFRPDSNGALAYVTGTITDSGGNYDFGNLPPNQYWVTEGQPPNYLDGQEHVGSTGGVLQVNDVISAIPLLSGQTSFGNTFGEMYAAQIGGFVYVDANNDGIKGTGETGIPSATVILTGVAGTGTATTTIAPITLTTGSDGSYTFTPLAAGTYKVSELQPPGYPDGLDTAGTTGGDATVNDVISSIPLRSGQYSSGNNFGELPKTSLDGFVYLDANNDGIKGTGETGIPSVTVILTGVAGTATTTITPITRTTGSDGSYTFTALAAGTYKVTELQPPGYTDGLDTAGTTGGDVTVNDVISSIPLLSGQTSSGNNFGELSSLGGAVYFDANNDGLKGTGEAGIPGVSIALDLWSGSAYVFVAGTTTDAAGNYAFGGLAPGKYRLDEAQPPGFLDGKDTPGTLGGDASVNDVISAIPVSAPGSGYLFGEQPNVYPDGGGIDAYLIPLGVALIEPYTGGLRVRSALDFDASPGTSVGRDPALVYNSDTVAVRPITPFNYTANPGEVPAYIQARLVWNNGAPQAWQTFQTTGHPAGDSYRLALQVDSPVTATGVYPYRIDALVPRADGSGSDSYSLYAAVPVVARDSSPFGAGWGLDGLDSLVSVPGGGGVAAGQLWVRGNGDTRFFAAFGGSGGQYLSPPDDPGTLVGLGDGTYLYTAKDRSTELFDPAGHLIAAVDSAGVGVAYSYGGNGLLSGVSSPDGGGAILSYTGGQISSIVTAGNRVYGASVNASGQLAGIVDTNSSPRSFGYDSQGRMTGEAWGPIVDAYGYDAFSGRLIGDDLGAGVGSSYSFAPQQVRELSQYPALSASDDAALWLDPRLNLTRYQADTAGRLIERVTPDGAAEFWLRNAAGDVVVHAAPALPSDPPAPVTFYAFNSARDLLAVNNPDGGWATFSYDPAFHQLTGQTNSVFQRSIYTVDPGTGRRTSEQNAAGTSYFTYYPTGGTWSGLLQQSIDANGNPTSFFYDASRRPTRVQDAAGGLATTAYDLAGNPYWTSDPIGRLTTFAYDGRNRLTASMAADGGITATQFDAIGNATWQSDALQRVSTFAYDRRDWRVGASRGVGTPQVAREAVAYDGAGNPIASLDALQRATYTDYDSRNRPTRVLDASTNYSWTSYDARGNPVSTTDAALYSTFAFYDRMDRSTAAIDAAGGVSYAYFDTAGEKIAVTNARNYTTATWYDLAGRPTQVVDPLFGVATTWYDAAGRPTVSSDPSGFARATGYDPVGRVTQTIDGYGTPLARSNGTAYDLAGQATWTQDPTLLNTFLGYDAVGRLAATQTPDGVIRTTEYDKAGQVTRTVDPTGAGVTTYAYDGLGRRTGTTDGLGHSSGTFFDAVGNPTLSVDPLGHASATYYDNLNRPVLKVDPNLNGTSTQYDWVGNPTLTTDARGYSTASLYDGLHRQVWSRDPQLNVSTTEYDGDGNAIATVDALLRRSLTVFDPLDRSVVSINALSQRVSTVYDAAGRTLAVARPLNRIDRNRYDYLARVYRSEAADGAVTTTVFDSADRVLASVDANGKTSSTQYDPAGRPTATVDALLYRTTTVYSANGRVSGTIDAAGSATAYAYDLVGRRIATMEAVGAPEQRITTLQYDDAGRQIATIRLVGGVTRVSAQIYDNGNRPIVSINPAGQRTTTLYDPNGNVQETDAPNGARSVTLYDLDNRPTVAIRAAGTADESRVTTAYDGVGDAYLTQDAAGTTTVLFDSLNRPTVTTDPRGKVTTVVYDAAGNAVAVTNPRLQTTNSIYDAADRPFETIDARQGVSMILRDPAGRETDRIDPTNEDSFTTRDAVGNAIGTDDDLNDWNYSYPDGLGRTTRTVDADNVTMTTLFDKLGRKTKTTDSLGKFRLAGFDQANNLISQTDERGIITLFGVDLLDRRTTTTFSNGKTILEGYDAVGNETSYTDQAGDLTQYGYDVRNNKILILDPTSKATAVALDKVDRPISTTDSLGKTAQTVYDEEGRPTVKIDELNRRTTTVYDNAGNTISVTDPAGKTTSYFYDELDRNTKIIDPLNRQTTMAYDAAGRLISTTDSLNRVTTSAYDTAGRLTATTDKLHNETKTILDGDGKKLALVDAMGNRTTWGYDGDGRLATETDARGKVTAYFYDDAGRLIETVDRLGRKVDTVYDDLNRKTGEIWKTSAGVEVQRQTWAYDYADRLTVAADPDGIYTFSYDIDSRPTRVQEPFGQVLTMGYDADGRRTSVQDSQGGLTTTGYDAAGEVTSKSWSAGGVGGAVTYSYDSRGMVSGESRFQDSAATVKIGSTANGFDDAGRLTSITQRIGTGVALWTGTYTYDYGDRLTQKVENGSPTTYGYDAADEVIRTNSGATTTYDKTGNRTNAGYATATGNRSTSDGTWTYIYDDAGNQIGKSKAGESWVYGFDYRNQLVTAAKTVGGTTTRVTYSYDAFGNQIARNDGTNTTWYSVDGWDTSKPQAVGTENFDNWAELNGSGGTGALLNRRVYGSGFDEPIAKTAGGTQTWYGLDHQNSVRSIFNNSGFIAGTRTYDAFGAITSSSGSVDALGYTGTKLDAFTQLVGDNARAYDPTTGRWIGEDSLRFSAGDPNLYRNVGNQVTTKRDPSGMFDNIEFGNIVRQMAAENPYYQRHYDWMMQEDVHPYSVWLLSGLNSEMTVGKYLKINEKLSAKRAALEFYDVAKARYQAKNEQFLVDYNAARGTPLDLSVPKVDYIHEFVTGLKNGATVMTNELTFQAFSDLDAESKRLIEEDPNLKVSQICGVVAREALVQAATGGAGGAVMGGVVKAGGKIGGVILAKTLSTGAQCATKTAVKVAMTGMKLYFTAQGIVEAGKAAHEAYESYENGDPPEVFAAKLTKGGIAFAQLGYDLKDVTRLVKTLNKDGFKKFFGSCFAAGTEVLTERGWASIESIGSGDRVWSRSEAGVECESGYREVLATFSRSAAVVELTVGGRSLTTTAEHPFWVRGRGWVQVNGLEVGDWLAGLTGEWTPVESIRATQTWIAVYNFEVAEDHTYFVGGGDWGFAVWAHNASAESCGVHAAGSPEAKEAEKAASATKPIDQSRPIHGKTKGHDATSFNEAKRLEALADTAPGTARFNQELQGGNGQKIPGFQPDAQRVKVLPDGTKKVDVTEVQSKTQTDKFMNQKVEAMKAALGNEAGEVKWVPPDPVAVRKP